MSGPVVIYPGEYVPYLSDIRASMPEPSRVTNRLYISQQPYKLYVATALYNNLEKDIKQPVRDHWKCELLVEPDTHIEYWAWKHVETGMFFV